MTPRDKLLQTLAVRIASLVRDNITLVGIDGVDGAGKTVLAEDLGQTLQQSGHTVIRSSVDYFHNPQAIRYRQGRDSPQGFFEDSYNYPQLQARLLDPLAAGGRRLYQARFFDHRLNAEVPPLYEQAENGSILIFDGIFLHRPELRHYWHFSIFLDVPFHISIPRGAQRGDMSPDPQAVSNRRYVAGQQIYLQTCQPQHHATVVINYENLETPLIMSSL